jgi:N-acetyl-alpha-D-muramate 1-phosphate uridylyltransferase
MSWDNVAAVVLAAGQGTRLAPLTVDTPKALCPVGGRLLLERALANVVDLDCAINAHHLADQVERWVDGRWHLSVEPELLGSAGALGRLKGWIDGRDVVVVNADAVHDVDVGPLASASGLSFLVADPLGTAFHPRLSVVACRIPWTMVRNLASHPHGLYEQVWRPAAARGEATVIATGAPFFDCGTPAQYLAAHEWITGESICRWPDARRVGPQIRRAIVTPRRIVLVR